MNKKLIELNLIIVFSSVLRKFQELDIAMKHFNTLHYTEYNFIQNRMLEFLKSLPKDREEIKDVFRNDDIFNSYSKIDDELKLLTSHRRLLNEAFFVKQVAYLELFFKELAEQIREISGNPIPPTLNMMNKNITLKPMEMCKYIDYLIGIKFDKKPFFTHYQQLIIIRNKLAHGQSALFIDNSQFLKINSILKDHKILIKEKSVGLLLIGDGVIYLSDNIETLRNLNHQYTEFIIEIFYTLISYYKIEDDVAKQLIDIIK